jgi:uncharacterized SAM-binding protein YcdF (DUF218 family)
MFFIVSKIIEYLLSPLVWIIFLVIGALFSRNPAKSKRFLAITLILCLFLSNNFLADEFMRMLEVPTVKKEQLTGTFDLGIVLGGGMIQQDKENDRLIFRANTDRILQALELYKEGKIKKMLISGGPGHLIYRDLMEAALLKKYLIRIGVPAEDILVDSTSDNTRQNAVNSAKIIARECPNGRFLLITSASHMRRSLGCFNKVGIKCTPYPTNKLTGPRVYTVQHLFIPDIRSLIFYDQFLHEIIGYFVYRIVGYI